MKRGVAPTTFRRAGNLATPRRGSVPSNYCSVRPPYQDRKPELPANYRRDRPPGPPPQYDRPNFIVQLRSDRRTYREDDVRILIKKCNSKPEGFRVFPSGSIAGTLSFRQWIDALEAIVWLWELRLDGSHSFTPKLIRNKPVPSDMDELNDRLKTLFAERVSSLIKGEEVQKWQKKLELVLDEIANVSASLKKLNPLGVYEELSKKKKGFMMERDLIAKRLKEFKSAMNCILNHLGGKQLQDSSDAGVDVFRFDGGYDWSRICHLIMRECRRFEDGLPIYAFRQEILRQIHSQQITVLIGETGSGKSTQLVQFLVDSGVAANESIICTQPRKIAAISLAHRVEEESSGCYENSSIICHPTYSSVQKFDSKVIFMTDHCLLLHYMNDKNLSSISCIIVDEAHERSLNTDLLLALVKNLLCQKLDLRLIIMSATADAKQLSDYFFGCGTFHVVGRNFPVDVIYVPSASEGTSGSGVVASYASDVVRMATEIHKTEKEGTILAFLTSQMEVEWACETFKAPSAIPLPLHGKLSYEDQFRIFQNYPGKRKVIFATNLAETSLTIPGVKYCG
ncbi:hypothetical protein L1049_024646 [Liquidambar formosana]|uniref:RNA helicase n=1 Tax=Liquidambar formosana TaxID=63359 RepID=A0AAP0RUV4_LIQFO